MIDIGGVAISDDMYLGGVTEASNSFYQQEFTVEGVSKLGVYPRTGGRQITLESQKNNGAIQGIWCQSTIDALKELEIAGDTVTLNHNGNLYSVKVVDTTGFSPLFQFEPVSPGKKYTGKLITIEV